MVSFNFAMKEWYDSSAEAGPQQRPRSETAIERPTLKVLAFDNGRLSIPPVVIDTHGSTGSSPLDAETKQIETWNAQHAPTNPQQGAGSGRAPSSGVDRTGCRPQFEGDDVPIDSYRFHAFDDGCIMPVTKMESDFEFLGFKQNFYDANCLSISSLGFVGISQNSFCFLHFPTHHPFQDCGSSNMQGARWSGESVHCQKRRHVLVQHVRFGRCENWSMRAVWLQLWCLHGSSCRLILNNTKVQYQKLPLNVLIYV